ncbi:hypothetical protein D3C79_739490 [compost metagenome]
MILVRGQGHGVADLLDLPLLGRRRLLLAGDMVRRQAAGSRDLQRRLGRLKLGAQRDVGKGLVLLLQLVAVHQIRQKNDNQGDQNNGPHQSVLKLRSQVIFHPCYLELTAILADLRDNDSPATSRPDEHLPIRPDEGSCALSPDSRLANQALAASTSATV